MPQFVLLQVLGVLLLLADVCRPAPANWERLYGLADLRHSSIWPRTHTSNSSLLHDRYRRFVQNRRAPGDDFIFNLEANCRNHNAEGNGTCSACVGDSCPLPNPLLNAVPPAKASQLSPDVPDSKFASNADRWAFLPDDIRVTFNPSQAGHSVFTVQGFAYDCPGVFVGDVVPMPDERFANGLGMEGERMLVCKRAVLPVDWRTNRNTPSTGQQTETKAMWASQYNLKKRIPDWVAFYVERGLPKHPGADARKNREFRPENGLESARYGATLHETRNVFKERCNCNRHAYQLGHLAPLDQYTYNAVAAAATFSSYNVVPQFPNSNTNGGDWWFFERYLSDFLSASNQQTTINGLHVVAGTYYGDGNYEMRRKDPSASSYLAIPTHMWQVICDPVNRVSMGIWTYNEAETKTHQMGFHVHSVHFIQQRLGAMYGTGYYEILPKEECNTGQHINDSRTWFVGNGFNPTWPAGCNSVDNTQLCTLTPTPGTVVYWDAQKNCI